MRGPRSLPILATLLALALVGGAARAQDGPHPGGRPAPWGASGEAGPGMRPGPPPGPGGPPMLRLPPPEVIAKLELTDAQRVKLDDAVDTGMRAAIRADADARLAELDLAKLLAADAADDAAVAAAIDRVGAARLAMLRTQVATRRAFTALLTPAQRATLRKLAPAPPR